MAKKIVNNKNKNKNKNKIAARSSSLHKTIQEGKDFVTQATRVIKKRQTQRKARKAEQERRAAIFAARRLTHAPLKSRKRPIKKAVKSKPAPTINRTGSRASNPPTVVRTGSSNAGVVRTGSSNAGVARTSSKNAGVVRTSSKNSQIEQELHDRLTKHNANIGELNFSLRWWDPNDLDLHVTCPCGTQIFYGHKKCLTCGGELDIDMNMGWNMSLEPVEHIFFKNPKKGLYKFYAKYWNGPKQFGGVKGKDKSPYTLSLHRNYDQIFRYEDTVSNTQKEIHYDYTV